MASRQSAGVKRWDSARDNTKPYVLTGLGEQYVHYVLDEAAHRMSG